jgi:spectrin alpha
VTSEEVGKDYEHVEVMQKKFDDFQKDMSANEVRIKELTVLAERLKEEHYTEYEMIQEMIEVRTEKLQYVVLRIQCYILKRFPYRI